MSTRLQQRLAQTRSDGRAALIGYIPAGFPTVADSISIIEAMVAGGCDVVEVGLPYSDPTMDGPTIQRAAGMALAAGTTPNEVLRVAGATADTGAAALVMSYWNPVDHYGVSRFARDLAATGASGMITPDLLPEEAGEWLEASTATGLDRVFLVAPSSTDARLASTTKACRGFVYAASLMGVTGTRTQVANTAERLVGRTRAVLRTGLPTGLPTGEDALAVCVGLGISSGEQAAEVARYADGVIVGAGFCQRVLDAPDLASATKRVRAFAEELSAGVRVDS